jgi:2'-5' RNA ligase
VFSLNAPVPAAVGRLATDCAGSLGSARPRPRGEHTLVVKRLGQADPTFDRLVARVREALRGTPAIECRVARVDYFETAATGTSPVVYLAVESPGLERLHRDLCTRFDPAPDIEGDAYVPHVTVARGGSVDRAKAIAGPVDPVTWTVEELVVHDATHGEAASTVRLPA